MSAEAPRNTGTGEPISAQRYKGGISKLLTRLFGVPDQQLSQQSTLRIIQPAPGLEAFAAGLKQRIDNHLAQQRQEELERQNAEAARIVAEAKEKTIEAEKQKTLESQGRIRKERAIEEGLKILQEFQIADRLKIIQQTAWEGKGKVKPIEPDGIVVLGGFELAHYYPSHTIEKEGDLCRGRWRFAPSTDSTRIIVKVLGQRMTYEHYIEFSAPRVKTTVENGRFLEITSFTTERLEHVANKAVIPLDTKDSKTLLEDALLQDTMDRLTNQNLPSQVEKRTREERSRLPHWQKWIQYYDFRYDPSS